MVQTCDSEGNCVAWPKMDSSNSKPELSLHFLGCVCIWVCVYLEYFWPIRANFLFPLADIFHQPDSLLFIHSTLFRLIHTPLSPLTLFLIECFSTGAEKVKPFW